MIFAFHLSKNRPPTLGFWNLPVISFQIILAIFQKKFLGANETGKCWKETKLVKLSKNFYFWIIILYMMQQKIDPPTLVFEMLL